jgi:hypothetical protein
VYLDSIIVTEITLVGSENAGSEFVLFDLSCSLTSVLL